MRIIGTDFREPSAHAVRTADVTLSTRRVTAATSLIVLLLDARTVKRDSRPKLDGSLFTPKVRVKAIGRCAGLAVMTPVAGAYGARIRYHIDVRFFHRGKSTVGLSVMTALAGSLPVDAVEEDVTVTAGDDDFFPSFQLGYFATSAIVHCDEPDRQCRRTPERRLQFRLTRVTPQTSRRVGDRRIYRWISHRVIVV